MSAVFITATGTDIGTTFVTAGLTRQHSAAVGTISHTLTALEIMARRNLEVVAVVVSESRESAASLEDTVATIARFADAIDVIALPRLPPGTSDHPAFARLAGLIG